MTKDEIKQTNFLQITTKSVQSFEKAILFLTDFCHRAAREAGWWTDIETGKTLTCDDRGFGSMIALAHSEVSEALEGRRKSLKDDHLPQYDMFAVELADTIIRCADTLGSFPKSPNSIPDEEEIDDLRDGLEAFIEVASQEKMSGRVFDMRFKTDNALSCLSEIHLALSDCMSSHIDLMEEQDASRIEFHLVSRLFFLIKTIYLCILLAERETYDIGEIIQAKMAYNANRLDHKLENRLKEGGKKL